MLKWIVWNGIAFVCITELFEIELFWYLTVCKKITVLILIWIRSILLNWIAWNRNIFNN